MKSRKTVIVICLAALAPLANAIDYSAAANIATGFRPAGLGVGDFDLDGDVDFAVTTDTPDRVQVFTNTGNATFTGPFNYAMPNGSGPGAIAAKDMDIDGDVDLVVALHNSNQVLVMQNGGTGTFVLGQPFAAGANPVGIVAANFGGSALIDIATANRDGNSTSIFTRGTFGFTRVDVASGTEPRKLAAGDFDGDTDIDLVVSNHEDRTVTFLRNTGGAFSVASTTNTGERPEGVAAGDIDGDGDIDLAVAMNSLGVFKNNGNGTFAGPFMFATGGVDADGVAVADLDADGDNDVAVTDNTLNIVSIFENLGGGTLGNRLNVAVGTYAETVAVGDLDDDGDLDLLVANRDSNNVTIVKNNGIGGIPAQSFTVLTGIVLSGNGASLTSDDDNRLVIRPGAVLTATQAPIRLEVRATSPIASATNFEFELETQGSTAVIRQTLFLYNFQTSSYEQVDVRQVTTDDSRVQVEFSTNASRFIEPSTRQVRALVAWKPSAPVLSFPWTVGVDEARWRIR